MKIYTQDHGWSGCIVAVANDEAEAREIFSICYNYSPDEPLKVKEIIPGLVIENLGDS